MESHTVSEIQKHLDCSEEEAKELLSQPEFQDSWEEPESHVRTGTGILSRMMHMVARERGME